MAGTGGTPRAGVAYQWGAEWRSEGVVAPGDSGSAAIVAGGLGAGNITHIAVNTRQQVPVWDGGTSLMTILSIVGQKAGHVPAADPVAAARLPPGLASTHSHSIVAGGLDVTS